MDVNEYNNSSIAWYQGRLKEHGEGIKALSSGTEERREIRFGVLTDIGIATGCSVLDLGCGFADYYTYLQDRGIDVEYTGVDIVPEFIDQARQKHPGLNLQIRNLLDDPVAPLSFDYVVCSQTFNLRFGDDSNMPLIKSMMKLMFDCARKGVAIDFVTNYVDFQEPYLQYHSPEEMFKFAKSLTKRVVLRHDYPLYEFCLYLHPDFKAWAA